MFFSCSPEPKNVTTNRRINKDLLQLIFWKQRKCSLYFAKTLAEGLAGVTSPLNVAPDLPSEPCNTVGEHTGQDGAVPRVRSLGSRVTYGVPSEPGSPDPQKCDYDPGLLCGSTEILNSKGLTMTVPVPLDKLGSLWSCDAYSPACTMFSRKRN